MYVTFYLHLDFTCLRENVNAIKHSIVLSLSQGGKDIYKEFSALRFICQ